MRGNNPHFSRATVQHELIPGHHLQGFMTDRYNTHRAAVRDAVLDAKAGRSTGRCCSGTRASTQVARRPRRHAVLAHAPQRAHHLLAQLPPRQDDAAGGDRLPGRDTVGHERANAEGEVRRSFNGTYPPLYQVAYMIGGLQFRALHHELVDSGKMTDRAFHDAVLQGGRMPVEMVRASLTSQPMSEDYRANWRFYDDTGDRR